MRKIKVNTKFKTYPVIIGSSLFNPAEKWNNKPGLYKNIFVVVDENVYSLNEKNISEIFNTADGKIFIYKLKTGEHSKSFEELIGILSSLIENNFGRDTLLFAIGGGVTGDLAGLAASIYMRGIQLVHIPTTLLAMVDSSIGGKTGINFRNYKNIIGSFRQPEFILIDTDFLSTLPESEINSGIGEIIKYGLLAGEKFYNFVLKNIDEIYSLNKKILYKVICESVLFKNSVVSKDESESGLRKILNLGHTFAHAYESYFKYSVKHGVCVCAGIISSLYLSFRIGFISEKKLKRMLELPLKMKLPEMHFEDHNRVIHLMYGDKKNREGNIRFVLLKDLGQMVTDVVVKEPDIIYSIKETMKVINKG